MRELLPRYQSCWREETLLSAPAVVQALSLRHSERQLAWGECGGVGVGDLHFLKNSSVDGRGSLCKIKTSSLNTNAKTLPSDLPLDSFPNTQGNITNQLKQPNQSISSPLLEKALSVFVG